MKKKYLVFIIIIISIIVLFSFEMNVSSIILDEKQLIHLQEAKPPQIYKNGILFTYKANAKTVYISGSFVKWEKLIPMEQSYFGVWYYFHKEALPAGDYLYKYKVDNFWVLDPVNSEVARDDYDQVLSLLKIPVNLIIYDSSPVRDKKTNEYMFWLENSSAQSIYIYGDFNNWNPFQYRLSREGNFWFIRLKLERGRYGYRYVIDFSKEILDPHNENILVNSANEPCSIIYVP
ncbi:MAG: hypothetical protein KBG82_06935 [Spirochaetes bacterium]|nr:hypothetical protein [Spirochaetota bacterium]NLJ05059.1 hypothetical protein [Exilispira sp.]MBP8991697.1 hypothetical protein [Spirochaetota bacterium]HNV44610.1 hypothetical protein [Exilispira sp.]HOV46541.1 hypothetical protein [Exilispira sp.]